MEKTKVTVVKGTMRERRRRCLDCGPHVEYYTLPQIYHGSVLPTPEYPKKSYICDKHLKMDAAYYEHMAEAINRELRRREQLNQQLGS